ncbi:hypothetical protein ACFTZF_13500 [Streptomyces mirabilis]|uniref:hypothetical protein n=1 Tax=Streptomyces mirabilis TaxID=68239 RepID=UPI003634DB11
MSSTGERSGRPRPARSSVRSSSIPWYSRISSSVSATAARIFSSPSAGASPRWSCQPGSPTHLQRLVDAVADDSGGALGVRVQHGAVPAHEIRAARVVPRHRLQRTARGEPDGLAVVGPGQVEVEGERGQFGQVRLLPEQPQGVIAHAAERNSRH